MRAPVSACLIVRNESGNDRLLNCLRSIRPHVEEICVVDTGSTDGTWELLQDYCRREGLVDKVSQFLGCNEEPTIHSPIANFSTAREESFKLATQPWVVWLDGDDVLVNGWNLLNVTKQYDHLENVLVMFPYEYSHDHHGNCTCRHYRERLIKGAKNGHWMGPVHEVWVPNPGFHVVPACDEVVWYHRREGKVDSVSNRNLRILEKWLQENDGPNVDARMLYYTALEYGQTGNLGKSIEFHMRYVEKSGWDDEKCLSMLDLAKHHQSLGNYERAVEWGSHALLIKENWREPRFSLARSYYYLAQKGGPNAWVDWQRCVNHAVQGLSLPPSQTPLFINPLETAVDIHRYLNVGLERLGRVHEARTSVETALKTAPDDPNLVHNFKWYTEIIAKFDLDKALSELVQVGKVTQDQLAAIKGVLEGDTFKIDAIKAVLEGRVAVYPSKGEIPPGLLDEKSISHPSEPRRSPATSPNTNANPLDIVLFTGQAWESWNPQFLEETGMGGSETMAWELSKRLVRQGNRVRVFADCDGKEGNYDGVEWIHWQKFLNAQTMKGPICDVIISSRIPDLVDFDFQAKLKLAWVHDVTLGDGLTNKRSLKFDRFLCLSNWHKGYFLEKYPFIHPDSVIVTRNGINLDRYTANVTRDPHRMIYSSSPDRGLHTAVKCMPLIRAFVPDVTLHVYYGFENWEKSPDPGQKALATTIKGMLSAYEQFGVLNHGRVPGNQLAIEQLKSGVWAYPTWFSETSCCHPDTQISVPGDHRGGHPTVRIADLVEKSGFPVYAFNEKENRFQLATCNKVWETKIADELVGIELDSGETLKLTPDHLVLNYDGEWVQAGTLLPGDSLRALHYRYNVAIRDGNGRWTDEHRLVGEWKMGRPLTSNEHVDHSDLERLDNRPEFLNVMTASEHFSKTHKGKKQSKKHEKKRMEGWKESYSKLSEEEKAKRAVKMVNGMWEKIRSLSPNEREAWNKRRTAARQATINERMKDPVYASQVLERARVNGKKGSDARWGKNHKVVRVFRIPGPIPVYDMEVEGLHNFVADGVVIHNCITAMEAQAAGCRIVTSPIAALNETVGERGTLISGDWLSPEYARAFTDACVEALTRPGVADREALQQYARNNFSLDTLAQDWEKMFHSLIAEVKVNPLQKYQPVAA